MPQELTLAPSILVVERFSRNGTTGNVSLHNIIGRFLFRHFPAKSGGFFVITGVTNLRGYVDSVVVGCRIEAPGDSAPAAESSITVNIPKSAQPCDPNVTLDAYFPFDKVEFRQPGQYWVVVTVNGQELGRRPLKVMQVSATVTR